MAAVRTRPTAGAAVAARAAQRRRRRGSSIAERHLPLAYFAVAALVGMLLLPSALRPPAQQPNQTAELSPDAPPDENSQAIISSLGRSTSGVPTEADGEGPGEQVAAAATTAPSAPPTTLVPRACPRGFGNPPRQTESIYAPPCAAPFSGDNGGRTWKGVTGTEIRVAVEGWFGHTNNVQGKLGVTAQPGESAADRTFRVLQNYFNAAFQFYGRQVVFFANPPATTSATDQRAAAERGAKHYDVFAAGPTSIEQCEAYRRLERLALCFFTPTTSWYREQAPYSWSWYMSSTESVGVLSEFICKQLAGKPAEHAGEGTVGKPRRIGIVYSTSRGGGTVMDNYWEPPALEMRSFLRQRCGVEPVMAGFDGENAGGQSATFSTIVSRMLSEEVTTIVPLVEWSYGIQLSNAAYVQRYFPEWLPATAGALDRSQIAQLTNQEEWAHAFGPTGSEMNRPYHETECWKAYQSMDPASSPDTDICRYAFFPIWSLMVGLQQAGPDLTPTSFRDGLFSLGFKYYDEHVWPVGGGFAPGKHTYTNDVTIQWYDPDAVNPENNSTGTYRYVGGGRRYKLGELPSGELGLFREGVTRPPRGSA